MIGVFGETLLTGIFYHSSIHQVRTLLLLQRVQLAVKHLSPLEKNVISWGLERHRVNTLVFVNC
jgi:hypothetical protein